MAGKGDGGHELRDADGRDRIHDGASSHRQPSAPHLNCPFGTGGSTPGPGNHQVSGGGHRATEFCVYYRSPLNASGDAVNVLTVTASDGQLDADPQSIRLIAY
jgi:hypothetical protein